MNYKSTAKLKFESDIGGIVRKVVGIMDSVPIAASRQAVPVTAAPPSPVTPTVVKPLGVSKVQDTSLESEIKNPSFDEEDEFQDADTTLASTPKLPSYLQPPGSNRLTSRNRPNSEQTFLDGTETTGSNRLSNKKTINLTTGPPSNILETMLR